MSLLLPNQRLYNTYSPELLGEETLDLSVKAWNDIAAPPDLIPAFYKVEGLAQLLPKGILLPATIDDYGDPVTTDFLNLIVLTNVGTKSIKFAHNSNLCLPENKMWFIPAVDYTLLPLYSITLIYKQIPNRIGWWEFQI